MAEHTVEVFDSDNNKLDVQLSFFVDTVAHREAKKLSMHYPRGYYSTVSCDDGVGGTKITAYVRGKKAKPQ